MRIRPNRVAVVGYGSQGRAQALRLKRAGVSVVVGLRPGSVSRRRARRDGIPTRTLVAAARDADTVVILVPDQHGSSVLHDLAPEISSGALVVFAAGFPVTFPRHPLPAHCDIVLVAPHGPGSDLALGRDVSGFVGVHQDFTGKAKRRALAYARAIGLKPLFESSPQDEALGDLFGEQALLCGGLLSLTAAVAEVLINHGLSKQNAYFETVAQLDRLTSLLKERGVDGFWTEISDCAAAGAQDAADRIVDGGTRKRLDQLYNDIATGVFARKFYRTGRPRRLPSSWRVLRNMERAVKK